MVIIVKNTECLRIKRMLAYLEDIVMKQIGLPIQKYEKVKKLTFPKILKKRKK